MSMHAGCPLAKQPALIKQLIHENGGVGETVSSITLGHVHVGYGGFVGETQPMSFRRRIGRNDALRSDRWHCRLDALRL